MTYHHENKDNLNTPKQSHQDKTHQIKHNEHGQNQKPNMGMHYLKMHPKHEEHVKHPHPHGSTHSADLGNSAHSNMQPMNKVEKKIDKTKALARLREAEKRLSKCRFMWQKKEAFDLIKSVIKNTEKIDDELYQRINEILIKYVNDEDELISKLAQKRISRLNERMQSQNSQATQIDQNNQDSHVLKEEKEANE